MGIGTVSDSARRANMPNGRSRRIRKAVIPVAGLGTRMLPFTKAVPKEMLPIGNKPLIQHAVEEVIASGIKEVILVAPPGKSIIREHFSRNRSLEATLQQRGRKSDAEAIRSLSELAEIRIACQEKPLGLGHAVACARELVNGEPFALILPDAFIVAERPCLAQLMECYEQLPASYIATREVLAEEVSRFGMIEVSPVEQGQWPGRLYQVSGLVEKPAPAATPSRFGIFGRYLLEPEIFECLERAAPDRNHELQLSDALAIYCREFPLYAFCFEGDHYDVGDRLGFLQACFKIGLSDPAVSRTFRCFCHSALSETKHA